MGTDPLDADIHDLSAADDRQDDPLAAYDALLAGDGADDGDWPQIAGPFGPTMSPEEAAAAMDLRFDRAGIDPTVLARMPQLEIPAYRIGRRPLVAGIAAAGVPLAGVLKLIEASRPGQAAAQFDYNGPTPRPIARAPLPLQAAAASPEASPEAATVSEATPEPEAPFGELEVVTNPTPEYVETPVDGGDLHIILTGPENFDFSPSAMRQDPQIIASYLDPLVWIDDRTMEPVPWLAESWKYNLAGAQLSIKLREGVKWHDGTALTAEDVAFSFLVYRDDVDSAVRNFFITMTSVEVVNSRNLRVNLSVPDANFLANAASQPVFQKKLVQAYWENKPEGQRTLTGFDWRSTPPVGTGPWIYDGRGERTLTFVRNDRYWAGMPHVAGLTFTWRSDPVLRLDEWRSGVGDMMWPLKPGEIDTIKDLPGRLYASPSPVVMFAAFNFANPARTAPDLFADIRIRRALSFATHRSRYAREIFRGFVDVDHAGTFPQPWLRNDEVVNPAKSAKTARELLVDAGFERSGGLMLDATGAPLTLNVIVRNDSRFEMRMALRSIVDDFAAIGVSLRVEELGEQEFEDRWRYTHDFDLIAYSYRCYPGFTDFDLYGGAWDIRSNPAGWNPGGYVNADADAAIDRALQAADLDVLAAAVRDLQVAVDDDLFGLWLGSPNDLVLVRDEVLGFVPSMNWPTLNTRSLWRRPEGAARPNQAIVDPGEIPLGPGADD